MSDERSTDEAETENPAGPSPPPGPELPREHFLLQQAGEVIENLRAQMAELDRREQNVAAQTTALENERRRIRLSAKEFDEQMQRREEAFRTSERALEERIKEQEQTREELARRQSELEQQLADREAEREAGRNAIEEELAAERRVRRNALEAELLEFANTVSARRSDWETEAARKREELAALSAQLEDVREEKLGEIDRRESELQKKQVELEKRTRFHETHLNQLRQTLQQQQADLDRRQQLVRTEEVHAFERLDARRRQLARYRDRFTQREESLERERHLLDELRRSFAANTAEAEARGTNERSAWEQECAAHRADMRRQQDMLTLHAQNLEARRARLDQLRDDLEQTHRETLELRAAVEQSWGQLSQTFGEEATRKRVEQARTDLMDGYEKIRCSLREQQAEIDDAERRLAAQRERFHAEREEFTKWMSEREAQLQQREELLQRDIEAVADTESQWRKTRERWTIEKIEAESVIRQLLEELDADLTAPAPVSSGLTGQSPAAA